VEGGGGGRHVGVTGSILGAGGELELVNDLEEDVAGDAVTWWSWGRVTLSEGQYRSLRDSCCGSEVDLTVGTRNSRGGSWCR
jgi:hypothetical protein